MRVARPTRREPRGPRFPARLAGLQRELEARLARIPTRVNEYGYDDFGASPEVARRALVPMALVYRYWLRVETHGIERVPDGRVLLIANHAGNNFAWDGAMLAMAMLLEAEPPRLVRAMVEYYLPQIPFFSVFLHRTGSVVGTPENCLELLEHDEAVMVFPEGARGFVKPYRRRYELQDFGLGFLRMALATGTPIVPVGIVGSEEQSPGLANWERVGRWIGAPALPITPTFPWLGPLGMVPLPVKFRIRFGEPLWFEDDAAEEDARIHEKVDVVKEAIARLIRQGLAARKGWFR